MSGSEFGPILGVNSSTVNTGGSNTSGSTTITTPTVTSGNAFTPSATRNTAVYIPIIATTAGTYKVTYGPSTGAENQINSGNLVALQEVVVTVICPATWKVVVTITGTTVAIDTVSVQTI